jgi:hypothetical protein
LPAEWVGGDDSAAAPESRTKKDPAKKVPAEERAQTTKRPAGPLPTPLIKLRRGSGFSHGYPTGDVRWVIGAVEEYDQARESLAVIPWECEPGDPTVERAVFTTVPRTRFRVVLRNGDVLPALKTGRFEGDAVLVFYNKRTNVADTIYTAKQPAELSLDPGPVTIYAPDPSAEARQAADADLPPVEDAHKDDPPPHKAKKPAKPRLSGADLAKTAKREAGVQLRMGDLLLQASREDGTSPERRLALVEKAKGRFWLVIQKFPKTGAAAEARRRVEELER